MELEESIRKKGNGVEVLLSSHPWFQMRCINLFPLCLLKALYLYITACIINCSFEFSIHLHHLEFIEFNINVSRSTKRFAYHQQQCNEFRVPKPKKHMLCHWKRICITPNNRNNLSTSRVERPSVVSVELPKKNWSSWQDTCYQHSIAMQASIKLQLEDQKPFTDTNLLCKQRW